MAKDLDNAKKELEKRNLEIKALKQQLRKFDKKGKEKETNSETEDVEDESS